MDHLVKMLQLVLRQTFIFTLLYTNIVKSDNSSYFLSQEVLSWEKAEQVRKCVKIYVGNISK